MSWAKIDDKLWSHPKFLGLRGDAVRLWLFALSWAAGHETDGYIPRAALPLLGATVKLASALVAAGLWEQTEAGWQIHDYTHHNPTGERLEAKRRAAAERQSRARERRWGSGGNGDSHAVTHTDSHAVTDAVSHNAPVPSRPVQSRSEPPPPMQDLPGIQRPVTPPESSSAESVLDSACDREKPMPADWQPHPAAVAELAEKLGVTPATIRAAAEEYRAYWLIGGGAGKARRNWQAGFREHCRRSHAQGLLGAPPASPGARRGRRDPLADQLENDRAAGRGAATWLRPDAPHPGPTPPGPPEEIPWT